MRVNIDITEYVQASNDHLQAQKRLDWHIRHYGAGSEAERKRLERSERYYRHKVDHIWFSLSTIGRLLADPARAERERIK